MGEPRQHDIAELVSFVQQPGGAMSVEPRRDPIVVAAIRCARCDARGVPLAVNYCPRCGISGQGWAMLEQLPAGAMGMWRQQ